MLRRNTLSLLFSVTAFLAAAMPIHAQGVVQTGVNPATADSCSYNDYLNNLGQSEGSYTSISPSGTYLGRYQMGPSALIDAGLAMPGSTAGNIIWRPGYNQSTFLNSRSIQDQAYQAYARRNWQNLQTPEIQALIGRTLPDGTVITDSSLLKAGQFGWGRVQAYARNGGVCDSNTNDGNGVCVAEFMRSGSGFDVSQITGRQSDVDGECRSTNSPQETPWEGDTTSRTCGPTVAMLQAIPCHEYPASLQGFCHRYKPLQMNHAMCEAAERWAQNAPPSGPHLEDCKTQTFRDGTSSWSYVHACAKAEPPMGAMGQDAENQRIIGAGDDPACYARLEAMGVQFINQGMMDISTGGRRCVIPNALQYSGGIIPFDRSVTMNCALAEQIEQFGPIARGQGVTEYKVIGTLDCRGITNNNGVNQGKTSLHGFGNAIDINGFQTGSGLIRTSDYFNNASRKVWLRNLVDLGCSVFDGTLAFTFYKGNWSHIHWQATERTSCDGRR